MKDNSPEQILCKCKKVVVKSNSTLFIGGKGDPKKIKDRYLYLKDFMNQNRVIKEEVKDLNKRIG